MVRLPLASGRCPSLAKALSRSRRLAVIVLLTIRPVTATASALFARFCSQALRLFAPISASLSWRFVNQVSGRFPVDITSGWRLCQSLVDIVFACVLIDPCVDGVTCSSIGLNAFSSNRNPSLLLHNWAPVCGSLSASRRESHRIHTPSNPCRSFIF